MDTTTDTPDTPASGIEITYVHGCALYRRYPGQSSPQPCYVDLDCATGALGASYNPNIGDAATPREYFGHVQSWRIPCLREKAANALLDEIAPLAARVVAGYASEWDGHNHIATFEADAKAAIDEIAALCERCDPRDGLRVRDAADWLTAGGATPRAQLRADLKVTAETTDAALDTLANELEAEGDAGRGDGSADDGFDMLVDLRPFLRRLRDEARTQD